MTAIEAGMMIVCIVTLAIGGLFTLGVCRAASIQSRQEEKRKRRLN